MLSIELDPEIEKRLAEFARRTGRSEDSCVRQLIEANIEDLEDCFLAESRLKDRQTPLTSEQVRTNLAWTVEYDPQALKDLKRLDRAVQREITEYLDTRIAGASDPRAFGKALRHSKFGLWRFRVRDFRIICEIQDSTLVVLVVAVGHRSTIYDD